MTVLKWPVCYRRQPQKECGINWANPITRGLRVAYIAGSHVNSVNNVPVTKYGSPLTLTKIPTLKGWGENFLNTSLHNVGTGPLPNGSAFTWGAIFQSTDATIAMASRVAASQGIELSLSKGGTTGAHFVRIQTSSGLVDGAGGSFNDGKYHQITGVYNGSTLKGYGDYGIEFSSASASGTITHSQDLTLYKRGTVQGTGVSVLTYAFSRALSANEVRSLHANPWQIFAPTSRRIFISGGASAPFPPWPKWSNTLLRM